MREVKCFLMRLPILVRDLSIYKIYQELSYTEDDLSFELLSILRDKAIFHRKYRAFFDSLCQLSSTVPLGISIDELREELRTTIIWIMEELEREQLYNPQGRLPFNALWFDQPNCLMFYVMSKNDVDLSAVSAQVPHYRY